MSINGQNPATLSNLTEGIAAIAKGLSKLPCISYLDDVQLSDGLLAGSIKNAAVIACSDMGWLVPYVCSSARVQLYLFQNFGHSFASGGFVETVARARVEHVFVYGHSVCEYTKHLARSVDDPKGRNVLKPSEDQLELYSAAVIADTEAVWKNVGQYNVLLELKKMLADPLIATMTASGFLNLHGWFYNSTNHQLEVFDSARQAFIVPNAKLSDSTVIKFVPCEGHDR